MKSTAILVIVPCLAMLAHVTAADGPVTVHELDTTLNDYFWNTSAHVNPTCYRGELSGVTVAASAAKSASSAVVGSAETPFDAMASTCADGDMHDVFSTLPTGTVFLIR